MRPIFTAALTAATLLTVPAVASAQAKVCPRGEAAGNPNCVRPGVAKRVLDNRAERRDQVDHTLLRDLAVGSILDRDYAEVVDFQRLGLPRPGAGMVYWQVNDMIVAVDKNNREVKRIFPDPR